MNRRALLKTLAAAGASSFVADSVLAAALAGSPDGRDGVIRYLETHRRADGGYGWEDQADSHLTPTFAVIGCYHLLDRTPPNKIELAGFVREHHPSRLKKLEQEHHEFEFQQIQSLLWLGEDAAEFQQKIGTWKQPYVYLKQYEQHGYPIFRFEIMTFICRQLLGMSLNDLAASWLDYLVSRRRPNGSFNNTPMSDGSDGHVVNTWWGLQASAAVIRPEGNNSDLIAWLRACQLSNGGFAYQPKPEVGGVDDVAYTWAAVLALKKLGAAPQNAAGCVNYLRSLGNADGGFGDRPGWLSNPLATFYALGALKALGALDDLPTAQKSPAPTIPSPLSSNLKVFTIQIEAHGKGSPVEAVELARALGIDLWGAKNAVPGWIARAQKVADERKVPVKFFAADEEYGTWVNMPGLGTYSHTSDIIAPARGDFGSSLGNKGVVTWPEFRRDRLRPLEKARGHLIWQFGENEELTRIYLDDSLQRGGYAAISTFHFGNPDFTNTEPFLMRFRGKIPFIALQDAHGNEPWWFADMTTGFRTLFLATEPTWEGWLNALKQNWVAAVRHDAVSNFKTWMHAGSRPVLDFVRQHEADWKWWDNARHQRPLVSIVALTADDEFEVARPQEGVTLRARCAWENTTQGLAKKPLAELIKVTLDGAEIKMALVEKRQGQAFADHYHQFHISNPAPGRHSATATVRSVMADNAASSSTIEFTV
jgi:prenyltransferase beta subunit